MKPSILDLPGCVAVERAAFQQVLEELNAGFGDALDIKFEPLGWEDTLASTGRRSQEVINREIDRCDACRLGLRPDRVSIRTVGTESQPTRKRCTDAGPQLQKVLDFRKSLEESRQVLYHGFANEAEFKAEVDRHLRAFAKGELPPADAPRDKVLLPLAVLAEVQKEKAEKEQALARAEREQSREVELTLLWPRGPRLVPRLPYLHELRQGELLPRHVLARSTRRHGPGRALDRHPRRRSRRVADGDVDPSGGRPARLGEVVGGATACLSPSSLRVTYCRAIVTDVL